MRSGPHGDPPLLLSDGSHCGVGCEQREPQTSKEVEMQRRVGLKDARLGHKAEDDCLRTMAAGEPWLTACRLRVLACGEAEPC
jgi:hypothetical protein